MDIYIHLTLIILSAWHSMPLFVKDLDLGSIEDATLKQFCILTKTADQKSILNWHRLTNHSGGHISFEF